MTGFLRNSSQSALGAIKRVARRGRRSAARMKRIEINKRIGPARLRVSRTSAPNVSVNPARGVTLNSAHGVRLSRSWRGFNLALQNKRVILRGRWSHKASGINLNLSKSGVSVSKRTALGTFNFSHPNRSSVKVAGIQLRGKNAAIIAGVSLLFEFALAVGKLLVWALDWLLKMVVWPVLRWAAGVLQQLVPLLFWALAFALFDLPGQLLDLWRSRKEIGEKSDNGGMIVREDNLSTQAPETQPTPRSAALDSKGEGK